MVRRRSSSVEQLVAGYIRVSKDREDGEGISPELQREKLASWADRSGYKIVRWFEDIDLTGRDFDKRQVAEVIQGIKDQRWGTIAVMNWSRWGRNSAEAGQHIKRAEDAGGQVIAVDEPVDMRNPAGKLTRSFLLSVAEYQSDTISWGWMSVHDRRRRQGLPHTPTPRFGYVRNAEGLFEPDPFTGLALAEAYERYVGGESYDSIAADFRSRGIKSVKGSPIDANKLMVTMRTGFGAGKLHRRADRHVTFGPQDEWLPGSHPPVIPEDVWNAYHARMLNTLGRPKRNDRKPKYALSGLVRCECGGRMYGFQSAYGLGWRCGSYDKGSCRGSSILQSRVQPVVDDWLDKLTAMNDESMIAAQVELAGKTKRVQADVTSFESDVEDLARQRKRLTDAMVKGVLSLEDYEEHITRIETETEAAQVKILALREVVAVQPTRRSLIKVREIIDHPKTTEEQRRILLSQVIDSVAVAYGNRYTPDRVKVFGVWET